MGKPHIEKVYAIFQSFRQETMQMTCAYPSTEWPRRMREAQERCKAALEDIGLAQHIDWSNPNG